VLASCLCVCAVGGKRVIYDYGPSDIRLGIYGLDLWSESRCKSICGEWPVALKGIIQFCEACEGGSPTRRAANYTKMQMAGCREIELSVHGSSHKADKCGHEPEDTANSAGDLPKMWTYLSVLTFAHT
jgi:hypothetical protein